MEQAVILIVEDHPDSRELLQLWLRLEGFAVLAAQDGTTALALLEHSRPALIVTDLMMPEMSGFELIRRVRAMPEMEDILIIATSAEGTTGLSRAAELGAVITLCKPLDFE